MKPLILKIIFALLLSAVFLNVFGQVKKQKDKPAAKPTADTVLHHKMDAIAKKLDSVNEKASTAISKADSLKIAGKKNDSLAHAKDTTGMSQYRGKSYVFQKDVTIVECDEVGAIPKKITRRIAPRGTTFTVRGVTKNGELVISFWIWSLKDSLPPNLAAFETQHLDSSTRRVLLKRILDSANTEKKQEQIAKQMDIIAKRKTFNFKNYSEKQYVPASIDSVNDNLRYFLIGKDTLAKFCAVYEREAKKWSINYGTLVTTFKLRFNRFSFSNNLSVGGAVYYNKKIDSVWSHGYIGALSLSSVMLDAASTNLHTTPLLTTSTTRPAFSPSFHAVITYKNIDLTVGVGFDFLSKPTNIATATNPEAGWIYNGKPWLGIGLGFNLFSNGSSSKNATTPDPNQTEKPK